MIILLARIGFSPETAAGLPLTNPMKISRPG